MITLKDFAICELDEQVLEGHGPSVTRIDLITSITETACGEECVCVERRQGGVESTKGVQVTVCRGRRGVEVDRWIGGSPAPGKSGKVRGVSLSLFLFLVSTKTKSYIYFQ